MESPQRSVWERPGRDSWTKFVHGIRLICNWHAGGPSVVAERVGGGRDVVGRIVVGDVELTIRPGQALVIPDRNHPAGWWIDRHPSP